MQKILCLIARLIVARYECTAHVRHCKENAPIYMYYVAPETPMMSSVIADCPDLQPPPNILDKSTPMGKGHGKGRICPFYMTHAKTVGLLDL